MLSILPRGALLSCLMAVLIAVGAWLAPTAEAVAQAATDERRLAAHLHGAEVAFPADFQRVVHVHGDAEIAATFPGQEVMGMARGRDIWIRSGLEQFEFRYSLYHEMAHTAGWEHGPAMYDAVLRALDPPLATRAQSRHKRSSVRNRRQGRANYPRVWT